MRLFIYPYKQGSRSARALADALGAKRIKLEGSRFRYREGDVVINWGNTSFATVTHNYRDNVRVCSNKLQFFQSLREGSPIPDYTTDRSVASQWILEGHSVCCRTILNGHSGQGLILADTEGELVNAPLYTKYVKKKDEYRIHCYRDSEGEVRVFHSQRKARRPDSSNPNWKIRNHSNGFVYVLGDCNPNDVVLSAAIDVFDQSGLDFGAVDVGYNERNNTACVYEVNTAPGLEGTTLDKYVRMFREIL